jgi:hypothetical protein
MEQPANCFAPSFLCQKQGSHSIQDGAIDCGEDSKPSSNLVFQAKLRYGIREPASVFEVVFLHRSSLSYAMDEWMH